VRGTLLVGRLELLRSLIHIVRNGVFLSLVCPVLAYVFLDPLELKEGESLHKSQGWSMWSQGLCTKLLNSC